MSNSALDRFQQEQLYKGFWFDAENKAQAAQAERERVSILERLNERNIEERAAEKGKLPPQPPRSDENIVKLCRDWQNKYYHS